MGIFSKWFGKENDSNNNNPLHPSDKMMDEDQYWALVDKSFTANINQDNQEIYLVNALQKLSPLEIIGFRLRTDKLLFDTYNSNMWCAGYIMNGGCSDDGFEYFRCWVISRGKEVYYNAKANPDTLIDTAESGMGEYDFESFWYVALGAFEKKTGLSLYDYIAETFAYGEGKYPPFDFTWQEENPESMKAICPRLFEKFWEQV